MHSVYAKGSNVSHTVGKSETSRGLTDSGEGELYCRSCDHSNHSNMSTWWRTKMEATVIRGNPLDKQKQYLCRPLLVTVTVIVRLADICRRHVTIRIVARGIVQYHIISSSVPLAHWSFHRRNKLTCYVVWGWGGPINGRTAPLVSSGDSLVLNMNIFFANSPGRLVPITWFYCYKLHFM